MDSKPGPESERMKRPMPAAGSSAWTTLPPGTGEVGEERAEDAGDLVRDLGGRVVLVDEPAGLLARESPVGNLALALTMESPPQPE